jgi:polysaccharide biosynthesis transport protein
MTARSNTYGVTSDGASALAFTEEWPGGTRLLSGLDARSLWRVLLWRARLIAVVALGVVAVAAATLAIVPPKYKGTTILLVDPRQPRVTNSEAVLAGIGADAAAVESQVELIQSSALARKVIAKLDLASDPEFTSASVTERIKDGLLWMLGRPPAASADARINRLVYRFQSGLSVHRRGLTYILEVSYFSVNAEKAARISGAVAEAYLDDQRAAKREVTARASGWLGDRIEEMRDRVRRAERAVADYRSANRIVDVTQGNKLVARQIEDITQQLALARSRKAEARGRLERVEEARRHAANPAALAALGEVLQSQVIGNLRTQYAEAARLEAEYSALYGTRYPALVAVRAQLADLRRQIDREIERVAAGVRNDYEVASSRETALEAELAKLKEQSESFGQADVALRELEREAQAERALFEQFLSRGKETNEQQSLQIADARIVSPALTPIKPERPVAALLLAVAAACGLLFGVALVLAMERLRRGLRSASEVEQFVGLPNLGILPQQTDGKRGGLLRRAVLAAPRTKAIRYAVDFPASDYAASLWAIMARLRRTASAGASQVLVVASALPGEGKSTFAANLSLAYATTGTRTLLIDADVYAAETTRAFGMKGPGLCEILQGKAQLASATAKDVKTGLYVLGAREASLTASDLKDIDEKSIAAVLAECRKHFDLVVIDSPAILPADGGAFIEFADRAVMMVEWDRTERATVQDALAMLGRHKSKLTGIVLNKASPRWYRLFDCGRYLRYYSAGMAPIPAAAPAGKPAP